MKGLNISGISSADELFNRSGFNLENNNAKIKFNSRVKLIKINETGCFEKLNFSLRNFINIEDKKLFINSSFLPEFNKPASLKFYNITFNSPRILRDSIYCLDCLIDLYNTTEHSLSANVTGFSTYEVAEGLYCGDGRYHAIYSV